MPIRQRWSCGEFGGIANPSPWPKHSTRCDGPATIPATINASGERAGAVAQPLALRLSEIKMPAAAWRLRGRTLGHRIVATERFEVCDAVSAARMAVEIDYEQSAAAQLDSGHRLGEGGKPFLNLLGLAACGL